MTIRTVDEKLCDTKHEYLCKLFSAEFDKIQIQIKSAENALHLATNELNRRLEGLNELRQEVTIENKHSREMFVTKQVYDIRIAMYDEFVKETNNRLAVIETRSVVWTSAIGLFFVILQIGLHLWR